MYVIEHPNRFLLNLSRFEMAMLRKVVASGLLVIEDQAIWPSLTKGEQMILWQWRKRDPFNNPTGPRQPKALSSVT